METTEYMIDPRRDAQCQVYTMIEKNDVGGLEAVQIRGAYEQVSYDELKFVGFDYANQRWIEHTFTV